MTDIDKQRIAAVKFLESQRYRFKDGAWTSEGFRLMVRDLDLDGLMSEADAMHSLLVLRADSLMGAPEESEGAVELERISDTVERYERVRWPDGKVPGGKG